MILPKKIAWCTDKFANKSVSDPTDEFCLLKKLSLQGTSAIVIEVVIYIDGIFACVLFEKVRPRLAGVPSGGAEEPANGITVPVNDVALW